MSLTKPNKNGTSINTKIMRAALITHPLSHKSSSFQRMYAATNTNAKASDISDVTNVVTIASKNTIAPNKFVEIPNFVLFSATLPPIIFCAYVK